jgi:hypothetical protein
MKAQSCTLLVRCRLDESPGASAEAIRYVPLSEFRLWRHLMETRHGRLVEVEAVASWIPEEAAWSEEGLPEDELLPVLRVHLDVPGPLGREPVERFFPAETYPQALQALLSHYEGIRRPVGPVTTPGYFVAVSLACELPLAASA